MHDKISSRPILQFVAIQRRDTSEWALPGGKNAIAALNSFSTVLGSFGWTYQVCLS